DRRMGGAALGLLRTGPARNRVASAAAAAAKGSAKQAFRGGRHAEALDRPAARPDRAARARAVVGARTAGALVADPPADVHFPIRRRTARVLQRRPAARGSDGAARAMGNARLPL